MSYKESPEYQHAVRNIQRRIELGTVGPHSLVCDKARAAEILSDITAGMPDGSFCVVDASDPEFKGIGDVSDPSVNALYSLMDKSPKIPCFMMGLRFTWTFARGLNQGRDVILEGLDTLLLMFIDQRDCTLLRRYCPDWSSKMTTVYFEKSTQVPKSELIRIAKELGYPPTGLH